MPCWCTAALPHFQVVVGGGYTLLRDCRLAPQGQGIAPTMAKGNTDYEVSNHVVVFVFGRAAGPSGGTVRRTTIAGAWFVLRRRRPGTRTTRAGGGVYEGAAQGLDGVARRCGQAR